MSHFITMHLNNAQAINSTTRMDEWDTKHQRIKQDQKSLIELGIAALIVGSLLLALVSMPLGALIVVAGLGISYKNYPSYNSAKTLNKLKSTLKDIDHTPNLIRLKKYGLITQRDLKLANSIKKNLGNRRSSENPITARKTWEDHVTDVINLHLDEVIKKL